MNLPLLSRHCVAKAPDELKAATRMAIKSLYISCSFVAKTGYWIWTIYFWHVVHPESISNVISPAIAILNERYSLGSFRNRPAARSTKPSRSMKLWAFAGEDETVKKIPSLENLFKGRHFEREIIILCVRWYLRYTLSYRDLVEMIAERGLTELHGAIRATSTHFQRAPALRPKPDTSSAALRIRRCSPPSTTTRHATRPRNVLEEPRIVAYLKTAQHSLSRQRSRDLIIRKQFAGIVPYRSAT
jgi:hypothetical protein